MFCIILLRKLVYNKEMLYGFKKKQGDKKDKTDDDGSGGGFGGFGVSEVCLTF